MARDNIEECNTYACAKYILVKLNMYNDQLLVLHQQRSKKFGFIAVPEVVIALNIHVLSLAF